MVLTQETDSRKSSITPTVYWNTVANSYERYVIHMASDIIDLSLWL